MTDLDHIKLVATQAANEAGAVLLQHFAHLAQGEVHQKMVDGRKSPVTDWDLKANEIIRRHMQANFPDHDLLSEESTFEDNASEWLWVVDPLDGTWNYINNQPLWGVSIGIFEGKTARVAVLDVPFYRDLYSAVWQRGAFRNEQRLSVNAASVLADAVITVGHGHDHETGEFNERIYRQLQPLTREVRTHGSAALELVRVAYGEQSGTIMAGIKVWDVAAGVLLVREAGGRVTDLAGQEWNLQSKDIFASNGLIHDSVLGRDQDMNITVKVKTKTSQHKVEKLATGSYQAYLHSAPIDNQANDELIGLLAEEFKVKKYQIEIVKGLTARNKVIKIDL